jgi:branched-chain amino acid transport system permease protein
MAILGKINFGFACLPTIGAYTSGLLATGLNLPVPFTLLIGGIMAGAFGYILGYSTMRLKGPYFGVTTFAVAEAVRVPIIVEYQWTRGTLGLYCPPLFGFVTTDPKPAYFFMAGFFLVFMFMIYRIMGSKTGLIMKAIGDDDLASSSVGVNVTKTLAAIFALTSFFSGVAGAIMVHYIGIAAPSMGHVNETSLIIAMAMIGGVGSVIGPAIGAVSLEVASEYLRAYSAYRWVIFGLLIIVALRILPGGLYSILKGIAQRVYTSEKNR